MKTSLICFCIVVFFSVIAAQAEMMVITNKSVTQSKLSRQDVKDIFLGNKQYWDDKTKISVAALFDGQAAQTFYSAYLGMTPKQYADMCDGKLFTGFKIHPIRFKNSKQVVDFVTQTKGSIGFIDGNSTPKDVNLAEIK